MQSEITCLVVNSCLYLLLSCVYIRRKGLDATTAPLLVWFVSSLASIWYFTSEWRFHSFHDKISLVPFVYLFLLVWLSFLPLLRYDYRRIRTVNVNVSVFKGISWVVVLLSLAVFPDNAEYFVSHAFDQSFYLEQYREKMAGEYIEIFGGGKERIMRYLIYFKGLIPVFFVYSFTPFVRVGRLLKAGLLLSLLNLFLLYMNRAARFSLVTDLALLAFLYFLMRRFYGGKVRKAVSRMGMALGGLLVAGTAVITWQRFGEDSGYAKTMDYTLSLYAGESFVNFNGDMWNMKRYADGENCFAYFIDKWKGEDKAGRKYEKLERKVNRRMNVFYTFIGDYYTDFGRYWTAVIVVCLTVFLCRKMRAGTYARLGDILLLAAYVKILLMGITYWTYLNYTMELVVNIAAAVFLNATTRRKAVQAGSRATLA